MINYYRRPVWAVFARKEINMANNKTSAGGGASCSLNPRMNRVGGQAVLEGVMMKSGDNVALSAIVATLVGADTLVLLTDVDGLYDKNPQKNPFFFRRNILA